MMGGPLVDAVSDCAVSIGIWEQIELELFSTVFKSAKGG